MSVEQAFKSIKMETGIITYHPQVTHGLDLFYRAVGAHEGSFEGRLPYCIYLSTAWVEDLQYAVGLQVDGHMIKVCYREELDRNTAICRTSRRKGERYL